MIFFLIKILILVLLLFFLILVIFHFFSVMFKGQAPYIMTRPMVIRQAIANLNIPKKPVVYELGCGDAPFLRAVVKKYPEVEAIGVEHSLWPYAVAKLGTLFYRRIKIIKKDFFKLDLRRADLIYCYLNFDSMAKLEQKFLVECKDGAEIISYNFPLPTIEPHKVVRTNRKPIYFYRLKAAGG